MADRWRVQGPGGAGCSGFRLPLLRDTQVVVASYVARPLGVLVFVLLWSQAHSTCKNVRVKEAYHLLWSQNMQKCQGQRNRQLVQHCFGSSKQLLATRSGGALSGALSNTRENQSEQLSMSYSNSAKDFINYLAQLVLQRLNLPQNCQCETYRTTKQLVFQRCTQAVRSVLDHYKPLQ